MKTFWQIFQESKYDGDKNINFLAILYESFISFIFYQSVRDRDRTNRVFLMVWYYSKQYPKQGIDGICS